MTLQCWCQVWLLCLRNELFTYEQNAHIYKAPMYIFMKSSFPKYDLRTWQCHCCLTRFGKTGCWHNDPISHSIKISWQWVNHALSYPIFVSVMKMENIVPRAEINPTSLAFRTSVLTITYVGFSDMTCIPTPTCLCSSLHERSAVTTQRSQNCAELIKTEQNWKKLTECQGNSYTWHCKPFNTYNYIHATT